MRFNETTTRILVRKDYDICFNFYKDKIGLIPIFGDRNGPYTSFTIKEGVPPCFVIFNGVSMAMVNGYK